MATVAYAWLLTKAVVATFEELSPTAWVTTETLPLIETSLDTKRRPFKDTSPLNIVVPLNEADVVRLFTKAVVATFVALSVLGWVTA